MAKVVFMERSDGAFQKVIRTAETESDSFGASGSGPVHEKLRAAYDSFLRGYPDLDPEQCFAFAWRDLSLAERSQLRLEESGEWPRQEAEAGRLREASARADRRGERITTMKRDEQISILLKAVRGVLADDLTKSEREDVLRETFDDYAERTGRDGLRDISSLTTPTSAPIVMKAQTRQDLALALLRIKAAELRKARPELSESQAFAKVYTDPANSELAQIERAANEARFAEQAAFSYRPDNMQADLAIAKRDNALDALKAKAAELRKVKPELSESQAFAKVYEDPANAKLANAERQSAREALYA